MSEELCSQQKKRDDRQSELKPLRSYLPFGNGLLAPRGSGTPAQPPDLPKYQEIQKRTRQSKNHHWDTDSGDVDPVSKFQYGGSKGECSNADKKAHSTQSDEGAACAL